MVSHAQAPRGAQARDELGKKIRALGNLENEAVGIEIGHRYDDSPINCHESGEPPPYEMERFEPTSNRSFAPQPSTGFRSRTWICGTRTHGERDLVLARAEQRVAWRGDKAPLDADGVMDRVRGAGHS